MFMFFFFFSSRRRHTRFDCDWSSDVCSSDLSFGWNLAGASLNTTNGTLRGSAPRTPKSKAGERPWVREVGRVGGGAAWRSEEHTSELQSQSNLVCRLLLEKKKKKDE